MAITTKKIRRIVVVLLLVMLLVPDVAFAANDLDSKVVDIVVYVLFAPFLFYGVYILMNGLNTWIKAHANEDSHGMSIGRRDITIGIITILLVIAVAAITSKFAKLL
jgi:hypothetical protein